jgi:hypothetical protein
VLFSGCNRQDFSLICHKIDYQHFKGFPQADLIQALKKLNVDDIFATKSKTAKAKKEARNGQRKSANRGQHLQSKTNGG